MTDEELFLYLTNLVRAVPVTLLYTLVPMAVGTLLGLAAAVLVIERVPGLGILSHFLTNLIRGIPVYVLVFICYYGAPRVINALFYGGRDVVAVTSLPAAAVGMVTLSLFTSANIMEIWRGAISSVGEGQREAAMAGGMTTLQAYRRIVIPQAILVALPNYYNFSVGALKATSIIFVLAIQEMMSVAKINTEITHTYVESFLIVSAFYVALGLILAYGFRKVEHRVERYYHLREV